MFGGQMSNIKDCCNNSRQCVNEKAECLFRNIFPSDPIVTP
jgi:hypothetical protein